MDLSTTGGKAPKVRPGYSRMENVPHDSNFLALKQIGAGLIGVKGQDQGKEVEQGLRWVGMPAIPRIQNPHTTI
jgi:hypothetical protein